MSKAIPSEFFRFVVVGGTCALLNLALMYVAVAKLGVNYLVANGISFSILLVVGHFLNRRHTFRSSGHYGTELLRYVTVTTMQAAAGIVLLAVLVEALHVPYLLAAIVVMAALAVVSFLAQRSLVFRNKRWEP